VCTSCGSLSECPHDGESHEEVSPPAPGADTADPENTNAELLVRYGFMLDANDNDILTWTTEEIWDAAGAALADLRPRRWDNDPGYDACMEILRNWQNDAGWADSGLVIDTESDENRNRLYMTADGVLSHKLWLAIALAALPRQDAMIDVAFTRQLIERVAWVQTQMEQGQTRARNEGSDEDDDAYKALDRLIRTIRALCARRLDRISRLNVEQQDDRGLGLHSAVVGKHIDDLDAAQQKTHLAVTLALGEISIVESCVAVWDDLAAIGVIQAE